MGNHLRREDLGKLARLGRAAIRPPARHRELAAGVLGLGEENPAGPDSPFRTRAGAGRGHVALGGKVGPLGGAVDCTEPLQLRDRVRSSTCAVNLRQGAGAWGCAAAGT